jgi:predicted ATPase/DNA-binding CsgD family transcriptional regulator
VRTNQQSMANLLTRRELEILHLILENFSNNQIAEKLTLAPSSVKWYVKQIYSKLEVNERDQLAARAGELGLVPKEQHEATPRHNLPLATTPFIGRQNQIDQVRRMVNDPNCRLITLTGAGGVGKTRLALRIAESSISAFKHGVWLVELASVNDAAMVNQSVASVFGLQGDLNRDVIDLLRDFLREKRLLLVLDNCEQLIDACAMLVETLLRSCPELHILVTSREALDIEGESPFSVPSLTFPDPHHLPEIERLPQFEAVKLFVERTRSFVADFSINATNARDIVRICQRLDGIPLALELAAARVKVLGVSQIATHLEESFQLLAGGFRTALPRHQTMRASINWSYQLLSPEERTLLCRFSVFAGGWTLEAAKNICADETISAYTVIHMLAQLVNKSLVTVENEAAGGIRYYLLDAIWDFAREKLMGVDEIQNIYNSHLSYFLNLAQTAEPNLHGQEQIAWLDRLGHELPNLRIALDWALKTDFLKELRLASAIAMFWYIRGQASEGLSWLSRGLNALDMEYPPQICVDRSEATIERQLTRARSVAAAGFLCRMETEYKRALTALEESLAIYREFEIKGDTGLANTLLQLASSATALGNYSQSRVYAEESLAYYQAGGDSFGVSECYLAIGNNESDPVRAKNQFLDALEIKRKIGDINGLARTLQLLCEITVHETDFARAYAWLEESLDVYQKVGNRKSVVNCLYNLAWIAWVTGDFSSAVQRISESISLSQDIEEKTLLATGLLMRSEIRLSQGSYEPGSDDIKSALKIGQEMGDAVLISSGLMKQGRLAFIQGQIDLSLKILHEALSVSRSVGNKNTMAYCLYHLGRLACAHHDLEQAKDFFKQSMQIFYEMNFWYWDYIAYSLEGLARLALLRRQPDWAARWFGAANRLFQRLPNTQSPFERDERDNDLASAKALLSADEFQRWWDQGYSLTTQEAVQGFD